MGFVTGIGILSLPNGAVQDAKQDGWISVVVGGIYPLFLALLSIYYVNKHPNEDILVLSKKYLGVILGTICNILFLAQFIIYLIGIASGMSNIFIVPCNTFFNTNKDFYSCYINGYLFSSKGDKSIGKNKYNCSLCCGDVGINVTNSLATG